MSLRIRAIAFAPCVAALLAAGTAAGQTQSAADVTFVVPVNLTNLAGDITKVRVKCSIHSANLAGPGKGGWSGESSEITVSAGQVATTANVTVAIPANALDLSIPTRSANYDCHLWGLSAVQGWAEFYRQPGTTSTAGSFTLTPPVHFITGSFQW
ncbi:MAG: hypothetical protein ACRETI_10110 [Steroidobacteraceae bacterium]